MIRQPQAVGTGNGNITALFQFPGQSIHEGVALTHQNQNVTSFNRPRHALFGNGLFADHLADT
ncbi:hypothetical protein D3C72_2517950 [compost metagenome]